jgi:hypothetical protein
MNDEPTTSIDDLTKVAKLVIPTALVSAILYQFLYWWSFHILIFEFLSFSALISYSIVPVVIAFMALGASFVTISTLKDTNLIKFNIVLFVVITIGYLYIIGNFYILWLLLPILVAPSAAVGLESIKVGHTYYRDPKIRFAAYYAVSLVVLSGAAAGIVQAGGVLTRTDYYMIEFSEAAVKGENPNKKTRWIYLGKADELVFLMSETDNSIAVNKIDSVTPFSLVHHQFVEEGFLRDRLNALLNRFVPQAVSDDLENRLAPVENRLNALRDWLKALRAWLVPPIAKQLERRVD